MFVTYSIRIHFHNGVLMSNDLVFNFNGFASTTVAVVATSEAGRKFLSELVGGGAESLEIVKSASQSLWDRAISAGLIIG